MKSTGVVRRIDELGRIVLPIEIRRSLDINVKDPVEIFTDDDCIIFFHLVLLIIYVILRPEFFQFI